MVAAGMMFNVANAVVPIPDVELIPNTPGTPETRSIPFNAWPDDLGTYGYVEEEYLVSGLANVYKYVDPDGPSAAVEIDDADIPYVTRILVRRPMDSEPFGGTVMLEFLNATAGFDGAPMWDYPWRGIVERRAAWVGVTYDSLTANFLRDKWGSPGFPNPDGAEPRNNDRYATLNVQHWSLSWDLMMQVAALLKSSDPSNPFAAQSVERIIPTGYSQSASLVTTLANSFHDIALLGTTRLFDGYYFGEGGIQARTLTGTNSSNRVIPLLDLRSLFQVDAPVIRFFDEPPQVPADSPLADWNQLAYPWVRTYELAGGTHVDEILWNQGDRNDFVNFGTMREPLDCGLPQNPLSMGDVMSALFVALEDWIRFGTPAPPTSVVARNPDRTPLRDADGNVVGGVRSPRIEVPLGVYSRSNIYPPGVSPFDPGTWGDWEPVFCPLFGAFDRFSNKELERRYLFKSAYIRQLEAAVERAIGDGFLLPEAGERMIAEARASDIGDHDPGSNSTLDLWFLIALGLLAAARIARRKH
ncbi:MAG: alpha/beta hydrolase domain-containing protein [Gammaproteobacteria bacterium]|nr:alpha/beta hydrolase domain-containing protein [Gammaproteobacteria bacterium]